MTKAPTPKITMFLRWTAMGLIGMCAMSCAPLTGGSASSGTVTPASGALCTNPTSYIENDLTESIAAGEQVAGGVEFTTTGTNTTENVSQITLDMSSSGLTSATLQFYTINTQSNPLSGTLVGTTTTTTGLGNSSATSTVAFTFSPAITVSVGTGYYMVLSASGAFQLSTSTNAAGPLLYFNTGAWADGTQNETYSLIVTYQYTCPVS